MMDARKDRICEHAADRALPWAVGALGPAALSGMYGSGAAGA